MFPIHISLLKCCQCGDCLSRIYLWEAFGFPTLLRIEPGLSWGAGRPLTYQPRALGYFGAAYTRGRVRLRWDATYTGANSTDTLDTPELRIPARVIHDANVEWDAGGGFALGLDVRNVFDRKTLDLLRYPLPGRVVFVHFGWRNEVQ